MQLASKEKNNKELKQKFELLGERVKSYKEKKKQQQQVLEKIIQKSDKVISFFHNAAVVLGKSMQKMLHHLILNMEFDAKNIPAKIVNQNMDKLYALIRGFENNVYLKKRKLYSGMKAKINFYKKLEIPLL